MINFKNVLIENDTWKITPFLLCHLREKNDSTLQLFFQWKALFHRKFLSSFLLILTQI